MKKKKKTILETSEEARLLAKKLIRTSRFGALAVSEIGTGHPLSTRVAVAQSMNGTPVILASKLSSHTMAILNDPRCSLLLGEPGKGDPLAHPRITLIAKARQVLRRSGQLRTIRSRYLCRHPKAELYVDFQDFDFYLLNVERANLNGGFGKAFNLEPSDMILGMDLIDGFAKIEQEVVDHMNQDHFEALSNYAEAYCGMPRGRWRMVSIDPEGLDLANGERVVRMQFKEPLNSLDEVRPKLALLAKEARKSLAEARPLP